MRHVRYTCIKMLNYLSLYGSRYFVSFSHHPLINSMRQTWSKMVLCKCIHVSWLLFLKTVTWRLAYIFCPPPPQKKPPTQIRYFEFYDGKSYIVTHWLKSSRFLLFPVLFCQPFSSILKLLAGVRVCIFFVLFCQNMFYIDCLI